MAFCALRNVGFRVASGMSASATKSRLADVSGHAADGYSVVEGYAGVHFPLSYSLPTGIPAQPLGSGGDPMTRKFTQGRKDAFKAALSAGPAHDLVGASGESGG